jgi:hypothetical protein
MQKKCALCFIICDIPCRSLGCAGHHNESVGNICAYCATNERENMLFFHPTPSLLSSLEDFDLPM